MATYAFKTRQYGPSGTGSILTYQDLDYSLLFLSASILQKTGSMKVLGSMESSGQLTVGSSVQIGTSLSVSGITNLIDLNAGATFLAGDEQTIPLTVYDGFLDTNVFVVNTINNTFFFLIIHFVEFFSLLTQTRKTLLVNTQLDRLETL